MTEIEVVQKYYAAFNAKNWSAMLALLADDVRHEGNQSEPQIGLDAFQKFLAHMDACYEEQLSDFVFFEGSENGRVAAEFVCSGVYKKTDAGLPEARGQKYRLAVGAFFEVENGKIKRVTNFYNLPFWIKSVSE